MVWDQGQRDVRDRPFSSRSNDMKTSVTAGRRAPRASVAKTLIVLCCATAGTLILLSHPAAAFYSEVKPSVKVGVDCVGKANQLAPKLTACTVAGTKMRIWCPN